MKYSEGHDWIWSAIEKLNALRNELAHNLDSPKIEAKARAFMDCFEWAALIFAKDDGIIARLRGALAFLCGALSGDYLRK